MFLLSASDPELLVMRNTSQFYEHFTKTCFRTITALVFTDATSFSCRSQWPRGLRRRSAAARLLRSWVRILPGAWMFVCCECCVLSGRGLWDELITRPEKSYRLWCVVVCDLETSRMRRPWPTLGRSATEKKSPSVGCSMYRPKNNLDELMSATKFHFMLANQLESRHL